MSTPTNSSFKVKQKEVIHHEIIDLDLEEDDFHINGTMGRSGKGKQAFPNLKVGHTYLARDGSENDVQMLENDFQPKKTSISTMTSSSSSSQMELNSAIVYHETSMVGRLKRRQACNWLGYGDCLKKAMTSQPSGGPRSSTLPSNANNIPSSYTTPSTSASGAGSYMPVGKDASLQNFKRFDTVEDYSDHKYSKKGSSAKQPPKNWAKRIQEEWKILEKDLPETIYVRVYESRMDLLRAAIVGAEGTPYHDGLFFFDVYFPTSYPNVPPEVQYHSGGLRINPNLYECGKVCLSLLNTWSGNQKEEKWIPGVSTMLQVLVSVQGLILNMKPFFNEPGYAQMSGTKSGEEQSLMYNESTLMLSLQTMMYSMNRPPKYFEELVVGHFRNCAREIVVSCKAYLGGAQVGCLVKGGVQDVDEGDKSCSKAFKANLASFLPTLVNAFTKIGATTVNTSFHLFLKNQQK